MGRLCTEWSEENYNDSDSWPINIHLNEYAVLEQNFVGSVNTHTSAGFGLKMP